MGPLALAFTNEAFAPREDDLKAAGFQGAHRLVNKALGACGEEDIA